MRGRVRNEERVKGEREERNVDLMEEHCELTVAGRWREWVGGLKRGEERNGGISLHLSLTFMHKDSHAAPLPRNSLLNPSPPAERTGLNDL